MGFILPKYEGAFSCDVTAACLVGALANFLIVNSHNHHRYREMMCVLWWWWRAFHVAPAAAQWPVFEMVSQNWGRNFSSSGCIFL